MYYEWVKNTEFAWRRGFCKGGHVCLFTGWVRWVEAQRPKDRVSVLTGVSPSLAEGEWRRQGAGIVMEGWPCTALCLAYLGTVTQQVWFVRASLAVPYRLPWQEMPSCCYMVNVHNRPSRPQSWIADRGRLSMLTAPWAAGHDLYCDWSCRTGCSGQVSFRVYPRRLSGCKWVCVFVQLYWWVRGSGKRVGNSDGTNSYFHIERFHFFKLLFFAKKIIWNNILPGFV
jgi:hypothetical protein